MLQGSPAARHKCCQLTIAGKLVYRRNQLAVIRVGALFLRYGAPIAGEVHGQLDSTYEVGNSTYPHVGEQAISVSAQMIRAAAWQRLPIRAAHIA